MAEVAEARVLAGKVRVDEVIGRGGMGVVHRGEHLLTGRPVAVKLLRAGSDPTLAKRFVREVKAAAGLLHPNVVSVLDFGIDDDGTAFQVLELLDGEPLSHRIARGPISPARTLELLLPIVHALGFAHARGIVHRDIKPANVLLSTNAHGRVVPKLLDFGIAKVRAKDDVADEPRNEKTTEVGAVIGTPSYMSPEQARGQSDVGSAGDVWAMGVLLYECLSGRLPFEDENASLVMARVMLERAPPLATKAPEVPPSIASIVDRALEPDPSARPASMADLATLLRAAAVTAGVPVPDEGASDCEAEDETAAGLTSAVRRPSATVAATVNARPRTPTAAPPATATRANSGRGWWVAIGVAAVLIAVATGVAWRSGDSPSPSPSTSPSTSPSPSPSTSPSTSPSPSPSSVEPREATPEHGEPRAIAPGRAEPRETTHAPAGPRALASSPVPSRTPAAPPPPPPSSTTAPTAPPPTSTTTGDGLPEIRGW